jgi:hypothetical protein
MDCKDTIYFYKNDDTIQDVINCFCYKNNIKKDSHVVFEITQTIFNYIDAMKILDVHCLGKVIEHNFMLNNDDTVIYNTRFLLLVFGDYIKSGEYTGTLQ